MAIVGIFSKRRERERLAYDFVAKEIADGIRSEGLWLKAMSDANFNQISAKAIYVRLRVASVIDNWDSFGDSETTRKEVKNGGFGGAKEDNTSSHISKIETNTWRENKNGEVRLIGLIWIALGVLAYQAFGWLILGYNFTLSPLEFASRVFYSLLSFGGDLSITAIYSVQLVILIAFTFKGVRVLRSDRNLGKQALTLPEDEKQAAGR